MYSIATRRRIEISSSSPVAPHIQPKWRPPAERDSSAGGEAKAPLEEASVSAADFIA